jgi:hypothetical protein
MSVAISHNKHGTSFARALAGLEEYTVPIELVPGESLYDSLSRPERGLFFIEKGVMVRINVFLQPLSFLVALSNHPALHTEN